MILRGLRPQEGQPSPQEKEAQAEPGQEPSVRAARRQQIAELEDDLEERERKFRKYGSW